MTRASREQLTKAGFERVHVLLGWWDGPQSGIGDIHGRPHYFDCADWAAEEHEYDGHYFVRPIPEDVLALELELWAIRTEWIRLRREAGTPAGSGPRLEETDPRFNELTALLAPNHEAAERTHRRLVGELRFCEGMTYDPAGLNFLFRWSEPE